MDKQPCVYILVSRRHGTLYTGVTSNLLGRLYQHREKIPKASLPSTRSPASSGSKCMKT
jgi:predicted GIY-YIG superfamily endonuclease